jgi:hypothetical protein
MIELVRGCDDRVIFIVTYVSQLALRNL